MNNRLAWRKARLSSVMRAVAFRGWKCQPGYQHLVLTDRLGCRYELTIHPVRIRKL